MVRGAEFERGGALCGEEVDVTQEGTFSLRLTFEFDIEGLGMNALPGFIGGRIRVTERGNSRLAYTKYPSYPRCRSFILARTWSLKGRAENCSSLPEWRRLKGLGRGTS